MVLSRDNIFIDRSKHIDIKYQVLNDNIKKRTVFIGYIPASEMVADALTKAFPQNTFQQFVKLRNIE